MRDDIPAALASLQRAVTLAEPEGYVRIFVDEGPPMASLLRAAAKQGIAPSYVRRLLAAVNTTEDSTPASQGLIEPLSERELDVLRLLGTDLDGPEIARELVVSLNTVRTHTKNIYAKLGVNNRRAAVRRAKELDLSRTGDRQSWRVVAVYIDHNLPTIGKDAFTVPGSPCYTTGQTSWTHSPPTRRRTSWPAVMPAPHSAQTMPPACASLSSHPEPASSW